LLLSNLNVLSSKILDIWWWAGFCDVDASFKIKIVHRTNSTLPEVRIKIIKNHKDLLVLIREEFGGYLGYRSSTSYYESTLMLINLYFILISIHYSLINI